MPAAPDPPPPHVLARVARHEMVGLVGAQSHLLAAALAQLPGDGARTPAGVRAMVQGALTAAEQLASALDLLAGLEHPGQGRTAPLAQVLQTAVPAPWLDLPPQAPWLRTRLSPPAARAPVHAAPTRAVLSNVLRNAAEHRGSADAVGLVARRRAGHLLVVVEQSGECPAAVRECLAAPSPPATSVGLGLWIVRHLTTAMGGDVAVRARAPSGAGRARWQLRLRLPVAGAPATGAV